MPWMNMYGEKIQTIVILSKKRMINSKMLWYVIVYSCAQQHIHLKNVTFYSGAGIQLVRKLSKQKISQSWNLQSQKTLLSSIELSEYGLLKLTKQNKNKFFVMRSRCNFSWPQLWTSISTDKISIDKISMDGKKKRLFYFASPFIQSSQFFIEIEGHISLVI